MSSQPHPSHRRRRVVRTALVLAALGIATAACGSDASSFADRPISSDRTETSGDTDSTATGDTRTPRDTPDSTETADSTEPLDTTVEPGGDAIADIDDAQSGTIQVLAKGAIRDPEFGNFVYAGSGSGFFIDRSGLAVTNNHVVTGAATLEVYIGGDLDTSYNAHVLGVSECNDLALIQVETAGDVPYFDWYDGPVTAGLDVYATGFPLGDPQYTITKGIIAKAKADGNITGSSSIDYTIQHDAAIEHGSSGGPLITEDGSVVGVNYAGANLGVNYSFYAISSALANGVVERLHDGDFEALGVNGIAISEQDAGIDGVWVSGVAAGTPASRVGLLPGDVITSLNGLPVGGPSLYNDYCDVIRTSPGRPIAIEVLRSDTQELLRGEINGDEKLTVSFSFADDMNDVPAIDPADDYSQYVTVTDDTGSLTLEIPAEWADVATSSLDDGAGNALPRIEASNDLDAFASSFSAPGVQFVALPAAAWTIDDVLSQFGQSEGCTDGGVSEYDDGKFVGRYQIWENCGGDGGPLFVVLATNLAAGGSATYLTSVQALTTADLAALDRILSTFDAAG